MQASKLLTDVNVALLLEILDNIRIREAIVDCKKDGDFLVLTNQADEKFRFFQQNLNVEEIKNSSITSANNFTINALNKAVSETAEKLLYKINEVAKDLNVADNDLKELVVKKTDSLIEDVRVTERNLYKKVSSEMLSKSEADKKLNKVASKDEVKRLINASSNEVSSKILDLLTVSISTLEQNIMGKLDNLDFVSDVYIEGDYLVVVVKNEKTKKKLPVKVYVGGGGGGGGGGSQDFKYTNRTPMPNQVGGLKKGTVFNGVSLKDIFNKLLYKSNEPYFSTFNLDYTPNYEVGFTIENETRSAFWGINDTFLLEPNSIKITYLNTGFIVAQNLPNSGTYSFTTPTITFNSPAKVNFRISAMSSTDTELKDDFSFYFKHRVYSGFSDLAILTQEDVKSLQVTDLVEKVEGSYPIGETGYKWICYPTYFGRKRGFKDLTSDVDIEMEDPITLTIVNAYGLNIEYYCHRSFYKLGAAIEIVVN